MSYPVYSSYPVNPPRPSFPNNPAGAAGTVQTVVVQEKIRPASTTHIVIAWVLAGLTALYWLPWAIAATRHHQSVVAIALINFFVGWTGIGWLATLIWACLGVHTRPRMTSVAVFGGYGYPPPPAPHAPGPLGWATPPALAGTAGLPVPPDQAETVAYRTRPNESSTNETLSQPTWPQYRQPG